MRWGIRGAAGAPSYIYATMLLALALAGCNTTGSQTAVNGARGATVAFDSIDGPPREVFDRLVQDLNSEAQARRLAVVSRADSSAYRVRGYLVAGASPKQSSINWIWDVYDNRRQRVLRIAGEQTFKGKHRDAWQALDGAAVQKIAKDSMDQLAAFLTSPETSSPAPSPVAYDRESSPEAAGIFRIFPASAIVAPSTPEPTAEEAADVPLPPHRPRTARTADLALMTTRLD